MGCGSGRHRRKKHAEAKDAEKPQARAEQRFEKTRATSEDAARRARSIAAEVEEVGQVVEDAKGIVEKASKELEKLFRE